MSLKVPLRCLADLMPRALGILPLSIVSMYFKRGWGLASGRVVEPPFSNTTIDDWFVNCTSQCFEIL